MGVRPSGGLAWVPAGAGFPLTSRAFLDDSGGADPDVSQHSPPSPLSQAILADPRRGVLIMEKLMDEKTGTVHNTERQTCT